MLTKRSIYPTLPAQDLARAKKFYAEKLGLTPARETSDGLEYRNGETGFLLFISTGQSKGEFTQAAWETEDIEAEVRELKGRGVVFMEYDQPNFKSVNGIVEMETERSAWFKDSEGNLLAIGQRK